MAKQTKTLFLQLPNGDQFTIHDIESYSVRNAGPNGSVIDCYGPDGKHEIAIIPNSSLVLPLDAAISPTPAAFEHAISQKDGQIATLTFEVDKLKVTLSEEKEWHQKHRKMDNDEIVDLANKNRKLTEWLATLITMGIITVAIAVINHFFPFFG